MENDDSTTASLAEERLRLEREALAVERERLAAARAHAEAEARLSRAGHPLFSFVSVTLLALLCFAGGLLVGIAVMENRQQRQREERLARALSQLEDITGETAGTNAPAAAVGTDGKVLSGAHRNVSVVVIQ